MGTSMLRRALSKNKGKERILFHTNGTFFTAYPMGCNLVMDARNKLTLAKLFCSMLQRPFAACCKDALQHAATVWCKTFVQTRFPPCLNYPRRFYLPYQIQTPSKSMNTKTIYHSIKRFPSIFAYTL